MRHRWSVAVAALASVILMGAGGFGLAERNERPGVDERYERYATLKSEERLDAYLTEIVGLQEEARERGLVSVQATVTLAEPMSVDSVEKLWQEFELQPKLIFGHAWGENGHLVSFGGKFKAGLQNGLDVALRVDRLELIGVVAFVAQIETEALRTLQGRDGVFLVDISGDEALSDNPRNEEYVQHLGWELAEVRGETKGRARVRP